MEEFSSEPTQFKVNVPHVEISLNASDIARTMRPSDIVNLIIELDNAVGEWEATLLLYHYFNGQRELAIASGAVPQLVGLNEEELWDGLTAEEAEAEEEEDRMRRVWDDDGDQNPTGNEAVSE